MSLKNPITTPDKLAAYRKAVERWKNRWKDAASLWDNSNGVKQGPRPTPDSIKPEKCDPSDFGLTDSYKPFTDKIREEVFK